jgi:hypothetical protein
MKAMRTKAHTERYKNMKNRLIVYLLPEEKEALNRMSENDVRPPDAQLRFLLVNEALRRGFLSTNANDDTTRQGKNVVVAA